MIPDTNHNTSHADLSYVLYGMHAQKHCIHHTPYRTSNLKYYVCRCGICCLLNFQFLRFSLCFFSSFFFLLYASFACVRIVNNFDDVFLRNRSLAHRSEFEYKLMCGIVQVQLWTCEFWILIRREGNQQHTKVDRQSETVGTVVTRCLSVCVSVWMWFHHTRQTSVKKIPKGVNPQTPASVCHCVKATMSRR